MKQRIKMYLKFLFQKKYRENVYQREKDGKIEKDRLARQRAEKKIIIIRRNNKDVGVFSDYIVFLRMIEETVERGYIPIIDRKTIKNVFFQTEDYINTWECFFEQPMKYSLEDIDYGKMEVYTCNVAGNLYPVSIMHCQDEAIVNYWRMQARKYIRFKKEIYQMLITYKGEILGTDRVLGVAIREGYIKLSQREPKRLAGHPVQASVEEMLELAEKYMKLWKCDKVYFTCQTKDTEDKFTEKFGEKAVCHTRNRPKYKDLLEGAELICAPTDEDAYRHELEYVTEIFLLSNCTSFICSENSGSEAAFIMSNGFEHFMCLDKGVYFT